jgi:hypothetical protein
MGLPEPPSRCLYYKTNPTFKRIPNPHFISVSNDMVIISLSSLSSHQTSIPPLSPPPSLELPQVKKKAHLIDILTLGHFQLALRGV